MKYMHTYRNTITNNYNGVRFATNHCWRVLYFIVQRAVVLDEKSWEHAIIATLLRRIRSYLFFERQRAKLKKLYYSRVQRKRRDDKIPYVYLLSYTTRIQSVSSLTTNGSPSICVFFLPNDLRLRL